MDVSSTAEAQAIETMLSNIGFFKKTKFDSFLPDGTVVDSSLQFLHADPALNKVLVTVNHQAASAGITVGFDQNGQISGPREFLSMSMEAYDKPEQILGALVSEAMLLCAQVAANTPKPGEPYRPQPRGAHVKDKRLLK
mgnify:CR=1 FL=1